MKDHEQRRAVGPEEVLLIPANTHRVLALITNDGQDALIVAFGAAGPARQEYRLRQYEAVEASPGVVFAFLGPVYARREGGSWGPALTLETST